MMDNSGNSAQDLATRQTLIHPMFSGTFTQKVKLYNNNNTANNNTNNKMLLH